jgi:arylsulfatase A-like enzyme
MNNTLSLSIALLLSSLAPLHAADSQPAAKPNILVIVADDLGWADVGYHGSPIKTPNIDRLCREGVELDQHYVAPMCTPTRTGLLTGRYWSRFGNTAPSNERVLPWDTVTLAAALKDAGYDTAITGKWHLGSKPEWGPRKFGFNRSHGSLAGGVNPVNHLYKHGPYSRTWHRNDQLIDEEGHVTDLIAAEAVRFVETKRSGPFFLYVPFTAVHTPFDEPQKWLDAAAHIPPDRRQYAACTQHMDDAIGQIIDALRRRDLLDNTLMVFFSDNGGTNGDDSSRYPDTKAKSKVQGLNTPLRGWKAQVYEGGIRVPACVYWKNHLSPRKVTAPLHVVDWMPTLCGIAGCKIEKDLKWDGRNIWPVLTGEVDRPTPRILYCQGVRRRSTALREGNWKLIVHRSSGKTRTELFDLAADPFEKTDLSKKHPERVDALLKRIEKEAGKDNDALPK